MIVINEHLEELEKYCIKDPTLHPFTLWDLRNERKDTEFYVDWENRIKGYMLIYRGAAIPSVILHGSKSSMENLLQYLDEEKAIIHLPWDRRDIWKGNDKIYKIYVMAATPKFYFLDGEVKEVKDSKILSHLFENPEYLVEKAKTYAIIKDGFAISSASALVYLPEVWVLGAVITKKEYRNMGLASRVIGHFMSMAYQSTKNVTLWVRRDNHIAIHLYKKYGFKVKREDAWINVSVDILP